MEALYPTLEEPFKLDNEAAFCLVVVGCTSSVFIILTVYYLTQIGQKYIDSVPTIPERVRQETGQREERRTNDGTGDVQHARGDSNLGPFDLQFSDLNREERQEKPEEKNGVSKKKGKQGADKRNTSKSQYSHSWLAGTLKGHNGEVTDCDFSSNNKYMATCAEDRTVMIWHVKGFGTKEHKSVRLNVEYDSATRVRWSPDNRALVISQQQGNTIQVYRVMKKDDGNLSNGGVVLTFPKQHQEDIINIGIACNGRFIMSCSSDTTLVVWDLKGEVLAIVDTHLGNNYHSLVSPCGRFVAASGFAPDVKIWEVCFKGGEFKEVKRAFELKGHSSGIYSFAFNINSTRMATVSKDGTWKLWNTDIEYQKGQEPYLLLTGQYSSPEPSLIALSPDGRTVAIASSTKISIFSGVNGKQEAKISDAHSVPIKVLVFSPEGKYFLSAGGRHIRVFHNIPGYKNAIQDLENKKKLATTQSVKERLRKQIEEAKASLEALDIADD